MLFLIWVTRYVAPEIAVFFGLRKLKTRILPTDGMARA